MGEPTSRHESSARGLPYVPGLDGVRGLPLWVMLAYHLEWSFVPGGVFSVSLFFTLSGYLITQLIVREFESAGRLDLVTFWSRRLRRLMPAALVTVLGVALVSITTPIFDGPRLRGDLLAALGYSANWRFAITGNSYEDLFTSTASPVQHFWSLAIEEQFYFAYPLVMIALMVLGRRWRRPTAVLLVGLGVLAVASLVAGAFTDSRTFTYYGTHVRAVEVLVGALLALVVPIGREISARMAKVIAIASMVGLAVFFWLVAVVHTSDDIVYDGGLAAFSLVACVLVLGATVPGPVRAIMSWKPLVWSGKVSYGVYLYHWPVFMAMTEERLGFGGWLRDFLRLAVTVLLAVVSFRFLEEPIRRRRLLARPRIALGGAVAAVAVVVAVVFVVARPAPVVLAGVDAPDRVVSFADEIAEGSGDLSAVTPSTTSSPRRVLVVGSDGALPGFFSDHVGPAFEVIDRTRPDCAVRLGGGTRSGCPSLSDLVADRDSFDVVVIGTGANERAHVDALIGIESPRRLLEFPDTIQRRFSVPLDYARDLEFLLEGSATLIIDAVRGDELGNRFADLGVQRPSIAYVDRPDADVRRTEFDLLLSNLDAIDDRTRVVVIGDSVSYGVARALNDVAAERFDVVWAGGRNCPLVEVQKIRWWEGLEFDLTECPTLDETWTPLFTEVEPDVLLVVLSAPEQSDQQYDVDGNWFVVGDDEFVRRHDEAMERLIGLTESSSTRVVLFTSPTIEGGALGGATFARPERVAAWNRVLESYGTRWPSIEFFDWAEIVERYETANGGEPGSLRGDGVHMSEDVLADVLAAELVPFLDAS